MSIPSASPAHDFFGQKTEKLQQRRITLCLDEGLSPGGNVIFITITQEVISNPKSQKNSRDAPNGTRRIVEFLDFWHREPVGQSVPFWRTVQSPMRVRSNEM